MTAISIRLTNKFVDETDVLAHKLHMSRTEYIRHAIEEMNRLVAQNERKKRIANASLKTRAESMRVNREFSEIEHDPEN
ncbi:MAG: CopG family transcriptional regulator [Gammaproteobacteria bacterium]|nr:CopG family transcriptional regulator [Gammaproteobacteria bacterium]